MPLITIDVIENVFTTEMKQEIVKKITDAMVEIEGEALRPVTWVRINEFKENDWAIGGMPLAAKDVHQMRDAAPSAMAETEAEMEPAAAMA